MKTISTSAGFQDAKGTVVASGTLMLTLSQTATITATGGQVTTEPIYLTLDVNGKITNTQIVFNDELSPSGTIYYGTVYTSNGCRMVPGLEKLQYSITGASFDLATAVQASSASPSYSGAVLLSPTGNQTITTGNLTLTLGSFVETANTVTGTGGLVRKTSPTLTTPVLGLASATTVNKVTITTPATGSTLTVADGKTLTASNSLTFAGVDGTTQTFQASDTIVGRATTDTLTNKTFTGASSGNSVTAISAGLADNSGAITGNGAAQNVFSFTLPANTLQANKAIRIHVVALQGGATNASVMAFNFGATNLSLGTITSAGANTFIADIYVKNKSGVTNAQTISADVFLGGSTVGAFQTTASAVDTTAGVAITITFNVANTTTMTPIQMTTELIQ